MITRQARRYPVKLTVANLNGKPVTDTFLLDLSAMGARLESSTPLALRYPVEISFLLSGAQTETKLAGVVVWVRTLVASPRRYLMGVEFYKCYWDIDQSGSAGKI
jgi:hypothetical protein